MSTKSDRPRKLCFEPPPKWSGPQRRFSGRNQTPELIGDKNNKKFIMICFRFSLSLYSMFENLKDERLIQIDEKSWYGNSDYSLGLAALKLLGSQSLLCLCSKDGWC